MSICQNKIVWQLYYLWKGCEDPKNILARSNCELYYIWST